MKRLITFICLIVVLIGGYYLITKGIESNNLNIASYETLETKSEALTKKLAAYDKRNQEEYDTAVNGLNSSIKTYEISKKKYEDILAELSDVLNQKEGETEQEILEEIIYSDKEKYKVDFLLVKLGTYGQKEGVDVIYQLTTSSTTDPNSTTLNYFLADLKFTVTGPYMNVANFISDLEDDAELGWEINDFAMANGTNNGYSGVASMFTIRDVPIDSESYLASAGTGVISQADGTSTPDENGQTSPEEPSPDANTTDSNTVNEATTPTDANSNTVANTTAN